MQQRTALLNPGVLSALAASATIIIPFTDLGQSLFHFTAPTMASLGFVLGIVALYFITTEFAKMSYYRLTNHAQV